jgi:hypothetical protein
MCPTTQELGAEKWVDFFNGLAAREGASSVAVEVVSEREPDQRYGMRRPLQAIAYNAEGDVLELAVGASGADRSVVLRHFIPEPRRINIEHSDSARPATILVDDRSGVRTRIRLFDAPTAQPQRRPDIACRAAGRRHRLPVQDVNPPARSRGATGRRPGQRLGG